MIAIMNDGEHFPAVFRDHKLVRADDSDHAVDGARIFALINATGEQWDEIQEMLSEGELPELEGV